MTFPLQYIPQIADSLIAVSTEWLWFHLAVLATSKISSSDNTFNSKIPLPSQIHLTLRLPDGVHYVPARESDLHQMCIGMEETKTISPLLVFHTLGWQNISGNRAPRKMSNLTKEWAWDFWLPFCYYTPNPESLHMVSNFTQQKNSAQLTTRPFPPESSF